MLSAFISSLRTADLQAQDPLHARHRDPVPGRRVDARRPVSTTRNVQQCIEQVSGGDSAQIYSLINLFSGGALLQLSVFAIGIMPYITASIIVQLLDRGHPALRAAAQRRPGRPGQDDAVHPLPDDRAGAPAGHLHRGAGRQRRAAAGLHAATSSPTRAIFTLVVIVLVMTAGAALVMWMGELITERGIGNGMSLLIFAGIAARIPAEGKTILDSRGGMVFAVVCVAALIIIVGVVFVEQGQRRIPVQYAKRMVGRRMYGGTSTYLPLKVNQAGVIPVIFASSLIYIPHLITQLIQQRQRRRRQRLVGQVRRATT